MNAGEGKRVFCRRRMRAWAGAVVLAVVSAFGLAAPQAQAHSALTDSTPADGATVTESLSEVSLVFNEPVQSDYSQVAVLDQDDNEYQDGDPSTVGETVTQKVSDLPGGDYTISYRIVSADGHPVSGEIKFTIAGGGGGSGSQSGDSTQPSNQAAANNSTSSSDDGTVNAGWIAAGALVVIAVAIGAAAVVRSRSRSDTQPGD